MTTPQYFYLAATLAAAYAVFGLTGFGAAMVSMPVLVQFLPLHYAVPLVLLLDLVCTTLVGLKNRQRVSLEELARLGPFLLLGVFIGATALASLESRWLLVGLGTFIIAMSARNLFMSKAPAAMLGGGWVVPAGVVGGVFSALFGTGGPIYTMYLSRRLPDVDIFRATISAVIFVSAIVRIAAFGWTGLLQQEGLVLNAALALPFCLAGLALGSALRQKFSAEAVRRLLLIFLTLGGIGVILRGLA